MICHRSEYRHLLIHGLRCATSLGLIGLIAAVGAAQNTLVQTSRVPPGGYVLGIIGQNTTSGLQISQVFPDSVAQRAGLEAGDVIAAVAGQKIGYVNGRLVDIANELVRSVDAQGRVMTLVQDFRTRQLVNIPLQFPIRSEIGRMISGRVNTQTPFVLTSTMILSVRLLDVTYPQWTDVVVGEQTMAGPFQLPATYQLLALPQNLKADHRYALDARVLDRGSQVLGTPAPVPVTISQTGLSVDLLLQGSVTQLPPLLPPPAITPPPSSGFPPPSNPLPYDHITDTFVKLLGRAPSSASSPHGRAISIVAVRSAMCAWRSSVVASITIATAMIRSSTLSGVYTSLYGVAPSPQQRQALSQNLLDQGGVRHRVVEEMVAQAGM